MTELQEDYSYHCPYCAALTSVVIDLTGGSHQTFVTDCEICCRPITATVTVDKDGISSFEARKEDN